MSEDKKVDEKVKKQLEDLEKLAVTRYTDYYDGEEEFEYDDKQTIINEFLHNSEIQEYYDLLGNTKKFDLKKK
ncbi:MAG: hypothetical protein ACXAD7_10615 [Candidatus Kariarchaeaceae archaeon]|jgi:hypothetical protein